MSQRGRGGGGGGGGGFVNYDRVPRGSGQPAERGGEPMAKRPRFDASGAMREEKEPDYDESLLEEDVFSGAGRKSRKGLRELDDDSDEEKESKRAKPEKKVKFLARDDIEGEEAPTGAEFESDGTRIEPFNMNEELEEGDFDESGFYTLKKDAQDSHDPWLDSISVDDIRNAKRAKEKYDRIRQEAELERSAGNVESMLRQVVAVLEPNETAIQALKRLGGTGRTSATRRKDGPAQPPQQQHQQQSAESRRQFDLLTEACDRLVGMGEYGIYSETREAVQARLGTVGNGAAASPSSTAAAAAAAPAADGVQWQYKWQPDGEVFGPFSSEQMHAWTEQGLFGEGGVLVRKLAAGGAADAAGAGDFYSSRRVDFSLYVD
eukprot:Unigene313_Nuclearia_a/m.1051 Unigene313_Nuclearia_a/g.1051  ORF Unigene313_Nuclearia_a/g.1051 Unigene313_Nuclearia_a/m.1051 type:complete len:377 (+) Unigene313_Nuclearia_a:47-1177(+)